MSQPNPEENPLWWGREVGEEEWVLYVLCEVDYPGDGEGGMFAIDAIEREGRFTNDMENYEWLPCEPPGSEA